jgi:protein phosphatase
VSTLVLPDPSLVVLVGAAGSGKSTLAARLFPPDEILSSDALRAVVSGNEADQRATGAAFRILHQMLERRLTRGETTVIDATNTKAEDRRPLLQRARTAGVPTVALVLDLQPETILAQNAGRAARVVNPNVIDRHIAAIRRTIDGGQLTTEGFDHVVLLRSPAEATALRLKRARPARPREPAPA